MNDRTSGAKPTAKESLKDLREKYHKKLDDLKPEGANWHAECIRGSMIGQETHHFKLFVDDIDYSRDYLLLALDYYKSLMKLTDPDVLAGRNIIVTALKYDINGAFRRIREILAESARDRTPEVRGMAQLVASQIDRKIEASKVPGLQFELLLPLVNASIEHECEEEDLHGKPVSFRKLRRTVFDTNGPESGWITLRRPAPLNFYKAAQHTPTAEQYIRQVLQLYTASLSDIHNKCKVSFELREQRDTDSEADYRICFKELEQSFLTIRIIIETIPLLKDIYLISSKLEDVRDRHVADLEIALMNELNTAMWNFGLLLTSKDEKNHQLARGAAADIDYIASSARDDGLDCELLVPFVEGLNANY